MATKITPRHGQRGYEMTALMWGVHRIDAKIAKAKEVLKNLKKERIKAKKALKAFVSKM